VPAPDFVLELRKAIGTAPLWLSGVTAVILDDSGTRMLLQRRADNGDWSPVTGIIDPGEEPAIAAAREALEEANVRIAVERLARVATTPKVIYENGDRSQYLDLTFRCRYLDGDPYPADGEASAVEWFAVDALPAMREEYLNRIDAALSGDVAARFLTA
jgi:8-oxo-dGTP pyrophosphatase MutT (NUDIX family)